MKLELKEHINNDLLQHVLKQTALVQKLTQDNESLTTHLQAANKERQQLKQSVIELHGKLKKLEGAQQPTAYLEQRVIELEGEMAQLKHGLTCVRCQMQGLRPIEFTMTNFEQHMNAVRWYSPPFYTHPYGYKMCLCVWPNGFGRGKGTHLGVTVYLMRGEFDDHLKWPFRGIITFVLLDQEGGEDCKDIVHVVTFDDTTPDTHCTRVVGQEVNVNGRGKAKVVPLFDLQPNYLDNDCIKLSIMNVVLTH